MRSACVSDRTRAAVIAAVLAIVLPASLAGCADREASPTAASPAAEPAPSEAVTAPAPTTSTPTTPPTPVPTDTSSPARPLEYVAIGDSYSSGAGTPGAPATGCRRSPRGYGAQVAAALGATYRDASCSGARTEHVTAPQPFPDGSRVPPQLDAVSPTTGLVTVSLGFNDRGFLRNLTRPGRDTSLSAPRVGAIGRRLDTVLTEVHERAPGAQVVLVGYPQLVPPEGSCAGLPWTRQEYAEGRAAFAALGVEMGEVAQRAGVAYVDVATASSGHDVCAGPNAWVNGARPQPGVAAPYHPFAAEQDAVAALVIAAVRA